MTTTVTIRSYDPDDRGDVVKIAADTAFFGKPVEHFLDDRQLFIDLFYRYYVDVESGPALVAQLEGQVVGFMVGSLDTSAQRRRWLVRVLPHVLSRLVRGHYHIGRRTIAYGLALAGSTLRHGGAHVDVSRFPAHLHINLLSSARGQGTGTRLLATFLQQLRETGVAGVHLNTTDRNLAACRLYEKVGFQLLDRRPAGAWSRLLEYPVQNRSYGLELRS